MDPIYYVLGACEGNWRGWLLEADPAVRAVDTALLTPSSSSSSRLIRSGREDHSRARPPTLTFLSWVCVASNRRVYRVHRHCQCTCNSSSRRSRPPHARPSDDWHNDFSFVVCRRSYVPRKSCIFFCVARLTPWSPFSQDPWRDGLFDEMHIHMLALVSTSLPACSKFVRWS